MSMSIVDEIGKLVALRDAGELSPDEFARLKAAVLGAVCASRLESRTPPKTRIGWALLSMLIGFFPFGLIAFVKASAVRPTWRAGDPEAASFLSESAKGWAVLSLIAGCVLALLVGTYLASHHV